MGNKNNIQDIIKSIEATRAENIRRKIEQQIKIIEQAASMAEPEYREHVRCNIQQAFINAVDDFYADYSPYIYHRRHGLYNLLEIEVDAQNHALRVNCNPYNMHGFRRTGYQGDNGLYDQVFRCGWHGGAGSIDQSKVEKYGQHPRQHLHGDGYSHAKEVPYWRTGRHFIWWGDPAAVASVSPLHAFVANMRAQKADNQTKFQQLINKYMRELSQ